MLDTDSFKEFTALHKTKKQLESELKDVKYAIAQKEQLLVDNLRENDMQRISISGKTCYIKINTFAQVSNKEAAIQILKDNGYEYIVKESYNAQSISKLVRDIITEDGELPECFGEIIKSGSAAKLQVTNS